MATQDFQQASAERIIALVQEVQAANKALFAAQAETAAAKLDTIAAAAKLAPLQDALTTTQKQLQDAQAALQSQVEVAAVEHVELQQRLDADATTKSNYDRLAAQIAQEAATLKKAPVIPPIMGAIGRCMLCGRVCPALELQPFDTHIAGKKPRLACSMHFGRGIYAD